MADEFNSQQTATDNSLGEHETTVTVSDDAESITSVHSDNERDAQHHDRSSSQEHLFRAVCTAEMWEHMLCHDGKTMAASLFLGQ